MHLDPSNYIYIKKTKWYSIFLLFIFIIIISSIIGTVYGNNTIILVICMITFVLSSLGLIRISGDNPVPLCKGYILKPYRFIENSDSIQV